MYMYMHFGEVVVRFGVEVFRRGGVEFCSGGVASRAAGKYNIAIYMFIYIYIIDMYM